jgi:predicted nuclease with RNAse H fold
VLTLGIDLAAQPKTTGTAVIEWGESGATLTDLQLGVDDDGLLELIAAAERAGIDAPLGWPDEFVEAITAHRDQRGWPGRGADQNAFRFRLCFRLTDRRLIEAGVRRPLSVSTDLIGVVAMRAANLLDRLASAGEPVDRAGSGKVLEVYPAPAFASWGINATGYKSRSGASRLPALLDAIEEQLGGLELDADQRRLATSDHNCLDAIVAALVARAAALGLTVAPQPGEESDRAVREGWIHMPTNPLADLVAPEPAGGAR